MKIGKFRENIIECRFLRKFFYLLTLLTISAAFVFADTEIFNAEDAQELIRQAEKLARKGQISQAEKVLRRAVAQYPKDDPSKLALAYLLVKQKNFGESFNLAFAVAKTDSKNSFAFAVLGTIYLNTGNFPEAEKLLINSVVLNKREALGWAGLGLLNFYENRLTESIINLKASVAYDSDNPDFIYTLAQVSARTENYNEAADAYSKYLQMSPDNDLERREIIEGSIKFLRFLGGRPKLYKLSGKEKTNVPIFLINNRPFIELRINGRDKPLKFVLDTGSGMTVISDKTAKLLNIKYISKGGKATALGGSGKFDIVYGFLKSMELGEVKVKNIPVYIREFHDNNDEVDGCIGLSVISKFLTTIDYGNLTFSLVKNNKNEQVKQPRESVTLPLRLTSSGFLSGEVSIQGIEKFLNFIVDTGATISVISDEVAALENIKKFKKEERLRVIGAAGVTENVSSFLLPKLTFGTHSREKLQAIALDLDLINKATGYAQAGILGGNFLINFRVTFDFKKSEITFVPNDK